MKLRAHIFNHADALDSDVFVDIQLPHLPRVGDVVYLSFREKQILEEKAKTKLSIATRYFDKWFYGIGNIEELTPRYFDKICFDDAIFVCGVYFNTENDFIQIELNDDSKEQ